MRIRYFRNCKQKSLGCSTPGAYIPHKVLHPEIQEYIKKRGLVQLDYWGCMGDFHFFIWVNDSKDRIDIEL